MAKVSKEERIAEIQSKSTIRAVIISSTFTLVATLITVFFAFPPFQEWIKGASNTDKASVLNLDEISHQVLDFAGNENPDGAQSDFWLIREDDQSQVYRLHYALAANQSAYAGLAFQLSESQNLASYHAVEFTLLCGEINDNIEFYIRDIGRGESRVRIIVNSLNDMSLRYELVNFDQVDFNAVKEIGLAAESEFAAGSHQICIKNIRFVR